MLFNSFQFAIFLPIVFIAYWAIPHKARWALLLVASYYFYMCWNPKYVLLILGTTLVSYLSAIAIEKQSKAINKRCILTAAIVICLGVLFFFKYFNFASESFAKLCSLFSLEMDPITLNVILPVGISFYTFQTLGYVIDVYRGDIKAERHFGKYATFVSFFPQLVAGPIERSKNLLPQIKQEHHFDYDLATYGLKQMAVGYFKKIVIADTISKHIGDVFEAPQSYHGFAFILAAVLFSIQIYCDFSGYSDIAIGTAKLFDIRIMTNFKSPYFSQSVKEFWSRWHISLSTWFKDYVYIPLGGNRVGKLRNAFNLMVTFLVSGLWHGANWTFVIWGGIHGLVQVAENLILGKKHRHSKGVLGALRIAAVFAFCVFTWVFFASKSFGDVTYIFSHMLEGISQPAAYFTEGFKYTGLTFIKMLFLLLSILILFIYDGVSVKKDVIDIVSSKKAPLRWAVYILFVIWVLCNIPVTDSTEFIYFQF